MSLNESAASEPRERWPREFDIQGVPRDTKVREALLQKIRGEQMPVEHLPLPGNKFAIDVLSPEFNAQHGRAYAADKVQPYAFQEYPKMLYSTAFDEAVERRRATIAAHNRTLRDPLQCRELPERVRLTKIVQNGQEEAAFRAKGFSSVPPPPLGLDEFAAIDSAFLSESERRQRESLGLAKEPAKPALSAETIIALNGMGKEELVHEAFEVYGVAVDQDATKIQIITAIQNK